MAGPWWCTPLIPALWRQRQVDLCEFEASLVHKNEFQDRFQSYRETLSQTNKNKIMMRVVGPFIDATSQKVFLLTPFF